jgi:hypothetical protein
MATEEFGYRTAHHSAEMMPPEFAGAAAMEFRPPSGNETVTVYAHDGIVVQAFKAHYPPVIPAVSYRDVGFPDSYMDVDRHMTVDYIMTVYCHCHLAHG